MMWVGEVVKDFLEGDALVLAETIREKRPGSWENLQ